MGRCYFDGQSAHGFFCISTVIEYSIPFKYGFAFDWQAFLPIAFIYLITVIETTGDLYR